MAEQGDHAIEKPPLGLAGWGGGDIHYPGIMGENGQHGVHQFGDEAEVKSNQPGHVANGTVSYGRSVSLPRSQAIE